MAEMETGAMPGKYRAIWSIQIDGKEVLRHIGNNPSLASEVWMRRIRRLGYDLLELRNADRIKTVCVAARSHPPSSKQSAGEW